MSNVFTTNDPCDCTHVNAVECAGVEHGMTFYQALGYGYNCPCSCHVHSDEQTIVNFRRFLRETSERGIQPITKQEDEQ